MISFDHYISEALGSAGGTVVKCSSLVCTNGSLDC